MEYIAEFYQEGGCDYSIGCGTAIRSLYVSSMEEAEKKVLQMIEENYTGEHEVQRATIYEVNRTNHVDVASLYAEIEIMRNKEKKKKQIDDERKLYERLKQKFG